MPREIAVAAIQLDATPSDVAKRLQRAEHLVREAAFNGAQIIVLPEMFNTGYMYDEANFELAETLDGNTVNWMRSLAEELDIYLAGTLLLRESDEIYNAMLLWSPHGACWRYDKNYPWGWERGYFRGRRNITVAHTLLGRIGMLVCWDTAHLNLWREYAGKVDLMLISSCPLNGTDGTYILSNGTVLTSADFGVLMPNKNEASMLFGPMINYQTRWLGVPCVATVGCGSVTTRLPSSQSIWRLMTLPLPKLWSSARFAHSVYLECEIVAGCKIIAADGSLIAEAAPDAGESWLGGKITLADSTPQPSTAQPASILSRKSYVLSDIVLPWLMRNYYQRGKEEHRT